MLKHLIGKRHRVLPLLPTEKLQTAAAARVAQKRVVSELVAEAHTVPIGCAQQGGQSRQPRWWCPTEPQALTRACCRDGARTQKGEGGVHHFAARDERRGK